MLFFHQGRRFWHFSHEGNCTSYDLRVMGSLSQDRAYLGQEESFGITMSHVPGSFITMFSKCHKIIEQCGKVTKCSLQYWTVWAFVARLSIPTMPIGMLRLTPRISGPNLPYEHHNGKKFYFMLSNVCICLWMFTHACLGMLCLASKSSEC